jgi:DNA-binding NtrC family response regulator
MPADRPTRGRVLVVEDEPYVRRSLADLLASRDYEVSVEPSVTAAIRLLQRAPVDVVLTDLKLGTSDGLDLIRQVRAAHPELPVVVLTGQGTIASAVECIKAGADDYILKPAEPEVLEAVLGRALASRALRREVQFLRGTFGALAEPQEAIGRSRVWQRTLELVQAAARTEATVLLTGESGTGKEVLARMVHRGSPRAQAAYVRVNCAAVPLEMWESEFFGHRKGSFTGATSDREGRFRLAHRGTLFMDEIGTMPLAAQAKILRVLQDGEFDRVGDEQPTRVDVRVVAATNSDLDAEVAAGRFRQDLFYRLNVVRIEVPPLRERIEDIPLLAAHFVGEISTRLGRKIPGIGPGVLQDLTAYAWPGNVRELRNVLERALIFDPGETLLSLDFPSVQGTTFAGAAPGSELNLRARLATRERELVLEALQRSGGVRKEAAQLLGIDQRNLPYYLRKHGIDPDLV